jgi:hypothetical protein
VHFAREAECRNEARYWKSGALHAEEKVSSHLDAPYLACIARERGGIFPIALSLVSYAEGLAQSRLVSLLPSVNNVGEREAKRDSFCPVPVAGEKVL